MQKVYSFMWWNMSLVSFESWELILQFVSSGLTKLDETIGYCWCPIVMRWSLWLQQRLLWLHHCDVIHWDNKAVSQWLLTFNLCVSVTWPLTCAFHIPCTHTPEIIDMHRGVCDNLIIPTGKLYNSFISSHFSYYRCVLFTKKSCIFKLPTN